MPKQCRSCGLEKDRSEFYRHPETADGLLNICKECKRQDTRAYAKTENGKLREQIRNSTPARIAHLTANSKAWRQKNPEKARAHNALWRAIRRGDIVRPTCCERCGRPGKVHAHHHDYSKPLEVEWLCPACHGTENPNFIPF